MKNDLQNLTEDISRLYDEIHQKTSSLGPITAITRLYDELQSHLAAVSLEQVDQLEDQIKSTLERLLTISKSLNMIKTIKLMLDGHEEKTHQA